MEFLRRLDRMLAELVSAPATANAMGWIARSLVGLIFVVAGYHKLGAGYAGTSAYMESMGVPGVLLPLVILLELGGGLALIAGFQTRLVALLLALFCVAAAFLFHTNLADKMQQIMFMKNLAIAGGLLAFTLYGGKSEAG